ncbi:MAG: NfeD family protein [Bacteroidales bacterium]|nr:NfeD family protein [Bacteroidales bacterium]
MELWQIWLIVALLFFVIEILTTGVAVICFSFGALASMIVALCGGNLTFQVIIFAFVSLLSLIFLRPMLVKLFYKKGKKEIKTNVDALIGRIGVVSETIDFAKNQGRVAVDGDDWKAVSQDDSVIEKGEKVEIVKIESIIVTVKRAVK